jgi:hypothetical protein
MTTEAFDLKVLVARLQAKGLPMAEDVVEQVAIELFGWAEESLAVHPNMYVKMVAVPAVQILKPLIFEAVDKIDGVVGQ